MPGIVRATVLQAGLLLGGAVLCAWISEASTGPLRRLDWAARPTETLPPADLARPGTDSSQPIREIGFGEAKALFDARAFFLDARRAADYREGHVAGAWNAAAGEAALEAQITVFEAEAHPASTDPLVLYCSGGDCEDSHLLAVRLAELGYRNLLVYRAGYPDWILQGQPVRKGEAR